MPHCDNCTQFYPATMPSGCPFCDTKNFHKKPWCQFCAALVSGVKESDDHGRPLRPNCPNCGRGPLIPTSLELKRRLSLDPAIEPFVPTPEEIKVLLEQGESDVVKIDGEMLAEFKIRRTHGPIELYVRSPLIEDYVQRMAKYFGSKESPQPFIAPTSTHPYAGTAYWPVNLSSTQFYSPDGKTAYSMRGYGVDSSVPGVGKSKGHAVDLSFLQVAGLKNGATFRFATVLDDRSLLECLRVLKDGVVGVYLNFMRPVEHSCIIAARTQTQSDEAKAAPPKPASQVRF